MGVYSTNRSHLGNYSSEEIIANENYIGSVGALQMTLENYQNDQAIFEAVLGMDFAEAQAVNEGVEVEVFTEASVGGFIDKIKEFIKKAWEKIKGLFQTFITKFNNVVMRDNKAFVDKYKKAVLTKDLSKMKYKWSKKKIDKIEITDSDLTKRADDCISIMKKDTKQMEDHLEKLNDGTILENILKDFLKGNSTDAKSFKKDLHEYYFEDEDEEEGLKSTDLTEIITTLSDKKLLSSIEKSKKNVDKYFNNLLSAINKLNNTIQKDVPSDKNTSKSHKLNANGKDLYDVNYKEKRGDVQVSRLNTLYKHVSVTQTAVNMYTGGILAEAKFHVAQCRRVFAKAAAFNPKAVKENAILIQAIGEAAEYEIMSTFEDYSM